MTTDTETQTDALDQAIQAMSDAAEEIQEALLVAEQVYGIAFKPVEKAVRRYQSLVRDYNKRTGANMEARWIDEPTFPKAPFFMQDFRQGQKGK